MVIGVPMTPSVAAIAVLGSVATSEVIAIVAAGTIDSAVWLPEWVEAAAE